MHLGIQGMCCLGVVCKEHQKVQIFYPSFPPQYLFHSFKAVSSPPTDLSLFPLLKPLLFIQPCFPLFLLLPGAPVAIAVALGTQMERFLSQKHNPQQVCSALGMCITRSTCIQFLHRSAVKQQEKKNSYLQNQRPLHFFPSLKHFATITFLIENDES